MSETRDKLPEENQRPASGWMKWLDQRTGVDSLLHEALDEPIPGGARWAYIFGSGLLYIETFPKLYGGSKAVFI